MKQRKRFYERIVDFTRNNFFGIISDFEVDIAKSKDYLDSQKEPKDDFERSYAQYRCQAYLRNKTALFVLNIGCAFLVIPYIVICLVKKICKDKEKDIVFAIAKKNQPKIPQSLLDKYENRLITIDQEAISLDGYDMKFMWRMFLKHPLSMYFFLHVVVKISIYRGFIKKYNPRILVVNEEFSCVSSIMTLYCEQQGIEHICIMHGEKDFYIRDSFFRFNKCYVWDEWYVKLFESLRAFKGQFVVEVPPCFVLNRDNTSIKEIIDYKYYLEGNEKLEEISQSLHQLKESGYSIKVRPHPTFTDVEKVRKYFVSSEIEDCSVSTEESIMGTNNAISLYSTVLLQAYFSGINVVIDDVNFTMQYEKLKDLKYILIGKEHTKLSDILRI